MSRLRIVHPWLLAAFPCLSIYSQNVGYTPVGKLLWTLLVVELIVLVLWLAAGLVLRRWQKASLLVSLLLLVAFSFGPIVTFLQGHGFEGVHSHPRRSALVIELLVLGVGSFLMLRARSNLTAWNRVAGIFGASLLAVAGAVVVQNALRLHTVNAGHPSATTAVHFTGVAPAELPDIYYIVPDAFGRSDVLRDVYDLDNSGFLERLRSLGFCIVESSFANYTRTTHSIPSTLNMEYVHSLLGAQVSERVASDQLAELCQKSRVVHILREQFGYTFVAFASGAQWTDCRGADEYLSPAFNLRLGEFGHAVLGLTPIPVLMDKFLRISPAKWHRERILFALDELPRLASKPEPTFVFAHLMCPHAPFVFDEEGNDVASPGEPVRFEMLDRSILASGTPEEIARMAAQYRMQYRRQVVYMSRRLEDVIAEILRASRRPPVIILQSDHGPSSPAPEESNRYWENFANLSAYHIPGIRDVPADMSCVNTFRFLLSRCFGADLAVLPNEYYWYDGRRVERALFAPYRVPRTTPAESESGADRPHAGAPR